VKKKNGIEKRILAELKKNPNGLSIIEISKKLSLSRQTVAKYIHGFIYEGSVEIREIGPVKLCYLRERKSEK
jgi:predicted transcriptional regulator